MTVLADTGHPLVVQQSPFLFLIRSLDIGGAERQLVELVRGLATRRHALTVVTFYDGGSLRGEIESLDAVRLVSLHKRGRWDLPAQFWRLWRVVQSVRPALIYSFMPVVNETALLVGRLAGIKVVWGLRASDMDLGRYGWAARWSFRLGAILSRFADLIIVNSQAGMRHHVANGYSGARMRVIPNGIDTDRFWPDRDAGRRHRAELGIAEDRRLVGLVARLDPVKDHSSFLRAAALAVRERPELHFLCLGSGPPRYREQLVALGESLGLGGKVTWLADTPDVPSAYNALDIATLCSTSEGFPNAVGEAMACGVPCIATAVGDAAEIVGDTGLVVRPQDPEAMAHAWLRLLAQGPYQRRELGARARARIVQEFNLELMAERTVFALTGLVGVA